MREIGMISTRDALGGGIAARAVGAAGRVRSRLRDAVMTLLLAAGAAGVVAAADWNELRPSDDPGGRVGHAMVAMNDTVYLWGGFDGLFVHDDLWVFEDGNWVEVEPENQGPVARTGAAVWVGDVSGEGSGPFMGIFGGTGITSNFDDLWAYDPALNRWSEVSPTTPAPDSFLHRGVALADGRVVFIGVGDSGLETWAWNAALPGWSQGGDSPLDLRGATVWTPDGDVLEVAAPDGKSYRYHHDTGAWTTIKAAAAAPRARRFAAVVQTPLGGGGAKGSAAADAAGKVWVFGGETDEGVALRDAWELDLATGAWTKLPDMPLALTSAAAALVGDGATRRVLLYSGATAAGAVSDRTFEFFPGQTMRLNGDRFIVRMDWLTPQGDSGAGQPVVLTDDTGYFWFFNSANVEAVVKVLDACAISGRYWVFAAGLTNVATTLAITDVFGDETRLYENPLDTPFQPLQDTAAFSSCLAKAAAQGVETADGAWLEFASTVDALSGLGGSAVARASELDLKTRSSDALELNGDRFRVTVGWRTAAGDSGSGQAVELTDDTGYFWFFNAANVEVVIKVLRACGINNHYWVFAAGLTNVEVDITVEDTDTGMISTYSNPQETAFLPIQDTAAFATCP